VCACARARVCVWGGLLDGWGLLGGCTLLGIEGGLQGLAQLVGAGAGAGAAGAGAGAGAGASAMMCTN
jgi:hypothetical protein